MNVPLPALLECRRTDLEALEQVLNSEREALISGQYEHLSDLAQKKVHLLRNLEQHFESVRCQMETDPASEENWRPFLEALSQARRKNIENGAMVQRALSVVHEALSILRGEPQDQSYSAQGEAGKPAPRGRELGKA